MRWGFVGKVLLVASLVFGALVAMPLGAALFVLGDGFEKIGGLVLIAVGFRGMILALDLVWGRPPALSKRPWERPHEEQQRRPEG